jgi:hypothetical protein
MAEAANVASPRMPGWWRRVLPLALCMLAVAGGFFYQYARVWMRTPGVPGCAWGAAAALRAPELVSGYEPHDTLSGVTVGLTGDEDKAVRCAAMLSSELPAKLTTAFAELDPERRAAALLALLRAIPPDPAHDPQAELVYLTGSAALEPVTKIPAVHDASAELDRLDACRFYGRGPCPSRPAIPLPVWLLGVPGALGVITVSGFGARVGGAGAWGWWRRRRERKGARTRSRTRAGA